MRRIIGVCLLTVACITLGAAVNYFDSEGTTLVSEYEPKLGGVYDE